MFLEDLLPAIADPDSVLILLSWVVEIVEVGNEITYVLLSYPSPSQEISRFF